AGGGGRIAIRYATRSYTGTLEAPGGAGFAGGCCAGAAGTVFLKDNAQPNGDLIVDGFNVGSAKNNRTTLLRQLVPSTVHNVDVRNTGYLTLPTAMSSLTVTDSLRIAGSSYFQVDPSVTFAPPTFRLATSSTMLNRTSWTVGLSHDVQVLTGARLIND